MKRVRYSVAMSLDGYIADPNGEYDWIVMDPHIDFGAIFSQFDTLLMGRKTYEVTKAQGDSGMTKRDRDLRLLAHIASGRLSRRNRRVRQSRGDGGNPQRETGQGYLVVRRRFPVPQPARPRARGFGRSRGRSGASRWRGAPAARSRIADSAQAQQAQGLSEERHFGA